jgi:hypothetical protein
MKNEPQPDYDHLLNDPNPYLHAAIATQEIIGWDNFLKARFSKAWTNCLTHNKPNSATNASSTTVLSKLANWSWDLFFETWKERNQLVFSANNEKTSEIHLLRQEAEVKELYEACNQLRPAARRHHQYLPLPDLLKARTSTLTLWLTQARQTLAEHRKQINKGREQTLLTRFFPQRHDLPAPITTHGEAPEYLPAHMAPDPVKPATRVRIYATKKLHRYLIVLRVQLLLLIAVDCAYE